MSRHLSVTFGCVGLLVCMVNLPAGADTTGLANRLPHNGNALIAIDVTKLLDSPLAKSEKWQSKLMSGYADRPLAIPGAARGVAITGYLHPAGMQAIWQSAVVDLPNAPRLEPMLQRQGGFLDTINGRKAAWTPRDNYYLQVDDNTLGVFRPGDRQAVERWTDAGSKLPFSPYLTAALSEAGGAPVIFAMDLSDAVGAGAVHYASMMGKLPSLEKMEAGRDALFGALGSVKGLKLKMNVGSDIQSTLTVDFESDVTALGDAAKPFVIDVLTAVDLMDPVVEGWDFKASGKRIVGSGTSDHQAIQRLVALLSPGDMTGEAAAPQARGQQQPPNAPPNAPPVSENPPAGEAPSPAAASQAYYRAIAKTLDQMSAKTSPTQSASWLHAQSKMIQQLPILGVDPVLIEWGGTISGAFDRAAQTLAVGQQQAQIAAAGVASPTGVATAGGVNYDTQGGSMTDTAESRAAFRNAQQQRRQAAQQQRAAAGDQALGILQESMATRAQVRTLMTQKYNVEF